MSDEQEPQAGPSLAQQLSEDLEHLDAVLNVGLGAGLAKGDINRVQVAEAHNAFNRVIENCQTLVRDNMRLSNSARDDEKTQQRINELEAELGQLRIFKRRAEQTAGEATKAEATPEADPKTPASSSKRQKKQRGKSKPKG